jgi:hypothetical protein
MPFYFFVKTVNATLWTDPIFSEDPHSNRPLGAGLKKLKKGVEHVQEDSVARCVQVPCGCLLRERGGSLLSLVGTRSGAALGHGLYRDA